jgi:uncharacterized protein
MTTEIKPVGERCNLGCGYCYENPFRDAGNFGAASYDLDAMKKGLEKVIGDQQGLYGIFTFFGGEPLLMKIEDMEEMIRWGLERFEGQVKENYGKIGIQTNGVLLTDDHIKLFKKYGVHVGISMDGPEELNDSRWAGTLEKTRETTKRSQHNAEKLLACGVGCSLIVTMWSGNINPHKRSKLKKWFSSFYDRGIREARIHLLEIDHDDVKEAWSYSEEEAIAFLRDMRQWSAEPDRISFDLFKDIRSSLLGIDEDQTVTCTFNACDPYTTSAVQGIEGDGSHGNCGRADHSGIQWLKGEQIGYERYLGLSAVPMEEGACGGCRFFFACKGQCPGTGPNHDWREKTDACSTWMSLFEDEEQRVLAEGRTPISLVADREAIEEQLKRAWIAGYQITTQRAIRRARGEESTDFGPTQLGGHGDWHGDKPHGDSNLEKTTGKHGDYHADQPHGDRPHGDTQKLTKKSQIVQLPVKESK